MRHQIARAGEIDLAIGHDRATGNYMVRPMTTEGEMWITDILADAGEWPWFGGSVPIPPSEIEDFLDEVYCSGLNVIQ